MTPRITIKTTPAFQIVEEEGIRINTAMKKGAFIAPFASDQMGHRTSLIHLLTAAVHHLGVGESPGLHRLLLGGGYLVSHQSPCQQ